MRGVRFGISGGAHIPDQVAALNRFPFGESFRVAVQMSVIIAVKFVIIELINGEPTGFTCKKFANGSGINRQNGSPARSYDIDRLMRLSATTLVK